MVCMCGRVTDSKPLEEVMTRNFVPHGVTHAPLPPHRLHAAFASTVHNRTFRYTRAKARKHPLG